MWLGKKFIMELRYPFLFATIRTESYARGILPHVNGVTLKDMDKPGVHESQQYTANDVLATLMSYTAAALIHSDDTAGRHFCRISIKFSLKFVPKGPINNIPALVQTMAWRKWLSENRRIYASLDLNDLN